MSNLHRNPEQWQRPTEFLPERFDNSDPLSLTPDGQKRHPLSFAPFFGGRRICLGKTFAEKFGIVIAAALTFNFDFEFVNKEYYEKRPIIGFHIEDPKILTRIKTH